MLPTNSDTRQFARTGGKRPPNFGYVATNLDALRQVQDFKLQVQPIHLREVCH
jgi:hypothetical protein